MSGMATEPQTGKAEPTEERKSRKKGVFSRIVDGIGYAGTYITSEKPMSQSQQYNQTIRERHFDGAVVPAPGFFRAEIPAEPPLMPRFLAGIVLDRQGPSAPDAEPKDQVLILDVRGLKKVGAVDIAEDTSLVALSPSLFGTDPENPRAGLAEFLPDGSLEIGRENLPGFGFSDYVSRKHTHVGALVSATKTQSGMLVIADTDVDEKQQSANGTWVTTDPNFSNAWKEVNPALNCMPVIIKQQ